MKRKLLSYLKVLLSCFWGVVFFTSANGQCVVTNTSSDMAVVGSLKWAVNGCAAGGTITFNIPGAGPHIIPIVTGVWPNGPVGIDKRLTILGPNQNGAEIRIDGQGTSNAFSIGWYELAPTPGAAGTIIDGLTLINCTDGISVGPVMSDNLMFRNNFIGVTRDGITGAGITNSGHGIIMLGTSTDAQYAPFIGTPIANPTFSNNVISGNLQNGIQLEYVANGSIINNKIGTNPAGTACVTTGTPNEVAGMGGNGYDGINLSNSSGFTIDGNVISCNGNGDVATSPLGKRGLYLENADNNIIIGNKIGTDITGNLALPNYKSGLLLSQDSDGNTIGGSSPAHQNIISGNGLNTGGYATVQDKHGIVIDWGGTNESSDNNKILGNYIGLAANGTCLGNSKNGVEIIGEGTLNAVGGTTPAEGNFIGCNGANGVSVGMGSSTNTIQNNYLGTNAAGDDRGNGNNGIIFSSAGSVIPLIADKELKDNIIKDNVIGFNLANGIQTFGPKEIDGIEIKGNYIGIDKSGNNIANAEDGILIQTDLTGVEIGGVGADEGNFIGNNAGIGINIAPENHSVIGTGSVIVNNYIGVGIDGVSPAGNGGTGITINSDVQGLTIGGTAANTSNIIAGNGGDGIFITGTNTLDIDVEGNNIGVDLNGGALANTGYGVQIENADGPVTIGGTTATASNTIYGNTAGGILVKGSTTNPITSIQHNTIGNTTIASAGNAITIDGGKNTISDNAIFNYADNGVNITGGLSTLTGNDIYDNTVGVFLSGNGATGNIIGTSASGNNIHENSSHGIALNAGANANTISNNQIGTDGKNGENGVHLDGASSNIINEGNVIVNHNTTGQHGVYISNSSNTNTVAGNFIGTDASNTAGLGNENGIMIDGSVGNIIGGTTAADKNIIAGNDQNGVIVQGVNSTGNQVQGNNIGIDGTGAALANGENGIIIQTGATGNTIGGTATGAGNTISGNTSAGIQISNANSNDVLGNKIGTNTTGTAAVTNGTSGISITGSTGNKIGDGTVNGNNTISGNTEAGVSISTGSANTVSGNNIGTNSLGTAAIANGQNGVSVLESNANILDGNTISGNTGSGILLARQSENNTIDGNHIGTNSTGTAAIPNGHGIIVEASDNNNIGGIAANTISGNIAIGIIVSNSTSTTITNNKIGVGDDATTSLSNRTGIRFILGGANNTVLNNTIAHNTFNGIKVDDATSVGNTISKNSMFCNVGKGISESNSGNDEFLSAQLSTPAGQPEVKIVPGGANLYGMFTGAGIAGSVVEVFEKDDAACEDCGDTRLKEGKVYLGSTTLAADGSYTFPIPGFVLADSNKYVITVTSSIGNNTSEFSLCSTIKCVKPDVTITPVIPAPVCFGDSVKLTALGGPKGNNGAMFTWYEASDLATPLNGFEVLNDSVFYAKISGDYLVAVRNGSCDSTSEAVKAIVSPPVILTFTIEHADSCETDGALLITGLDATTSYTLSYNDPALKTVTLSSGSTSQRVPLPVLSYTDIILDSAGCKSDPQTATINGQTPETLAAQKIDITVCAGTGSISIGDVIGTSYKVTYDYKSATAALVTVGPTVITPNLDDSLVINNLKAGDYTDIIIINDINNCKSTVPNITIDPFSISLDPTVTGSDSVCFGNLVSFAAPANTGAMFEWYSVPATGVISGIPIANGIDLNTYDPSANGTYRLIVSLSGCSDTSDIAYAYVADPQNYTVAIEQEDSCNTGAAILISGLSPGFGPYVVNYMSDAGAVGPLNPAVNSSGEIRIAIAAPENISVLSIDSSGCKFTANPGLVDEYSIDPPIKTVSPISLCNTNDGEISFSGFSDGIYTISFAKFPDAAVNSSETVSAATPDIIRSGLAPGDYITTIKRNNCTFTFRDTLVNPGEPIISVLATDPSQCSGNGSIEITIANTTDNYDVYYNGVQELSNQSGSPLTITKPAGTYNNIYVNITGATCASNDTSVTLTDPGKPKFTVTLTDPTLCNTANGSIEVGGLVSGRSYTVDYLLGGTAQTQISGTGPVIIIQNLIDTTYSNIKVTDVLTMCDSMQVGPFELKDPPIPTFDLSRINPSICDGNGQLILKNFTPNSTSTFQLTYNNPSAVSPVSITPTGGTVSIPLPVGVYTNVVISLNNCFSLAADTAIRNPTEVPEVNLSAPTQLCEGDMANFTATPVRAAGTNPTYAWTVNGNLVPLATGPTLTVSDLPVGNNIQVKVLMTSSSNCASPKTHESTRSVNITARPVAGVTGTTKICDGQNATLLSTGGVSGSKYQWYRDGQPLSNTNATKINASIPGLYTVEISNGANCSDISSPHLLEVISVQVYAGADKDVKVAGEVFTFPLEGISNGNSPRWNLIEGSGTITNPQLLNSPASLGIGIHKLMLTDSVGSCIATDEVVIRVRGQIWIPTAISPNGDGSNDAWFISGLESYDTYTIRVYNRYGNKVFESENSYTPWDGTRNGEPMPVATYYYVVEVKGDKNYQGPLTIMR
jgi:gliding motility-associated-like protein